MKPVTDLSDDELFAAIREQVNLSRNYGTSPLRLRVRVFGAGCACGWSLEKLTEDALEK